MEFFSLIDIGGTVAFAVSGTLAGLRKKLDLFGLIVIAFAPAIGGGTIRDVLIGHLPVRWITDSKVIILIVSVAILTILLRNQIEKLDKTLTFFDSLGLGFFTIRGIQEGLLINMDVISCTILGTVTACFGGVLRDILLNEIPILFRKEIYATACILGSFVYFSLRKVGITEELVDFITISVIFGIRILAIKKNISLPRI